VAPLSVRLLGAPPLTVGALGGGGGGGDGLPVIRRNRTGLADLRIRMTWLNSGCEILIWYWADIAYVWLSFV
jgi:hypothetical protein